jgi:mRNA deadenylase 3'-5' endonuclease subunit Ccr4
MRLANLQKEIGRYGAQIVCLQEIEPENLEAFTGCVRTFKNDDKDIKRGASFAFAPCGEPRTDGVAVLVDAGRFTIVHSNELTLHGDEGKKNAGLVVTLSDREASGSLIVACAHLLFNPKRGDARLRQCVAFLRAVEEAKAQATQPVRVVVCGDFNSYPDSAVYAFLARGSVSSIALEERTAHDDCKEHPFKSVNGRCVTAHEPYQDVSINKVSHSLALESVYALGGGEPGFTTYLPKGTKACVDYIWSSDLVPVGRLEPPPLEELRDGLPSQKFPSDHVALVARFAPPRQRA